MVAGLALVWPRWLAGRRPGSRPGRPRVPAGPRVAVRVGRGRRARRVVRRSAAAVVDAPARAPAPRSDCSDSRAGSSPLAGALGVAVFLAIVVSRRGRQPDPHRQPRADGGVRALLGRATGAERRVRRRVPLAQPVARRRPRRRAARAPRPAAGARPLPYPAAPWPLAGGGGDPRLRLARARVRRPRPPGHAGRARRRLRARCSWRGWPGSGSSRGRATRDGFGVAFNLFSRLAPLELRDARRLAPPAAVRAGRARAGRGHGRAAVPR